MHYGTLAPHVAEGLMRLRERIDAAGIPPSALDESLNIATWNIREFGRRERDEIAICYIAEIINQFDIVALTELRSNLGDLARVMKRLGGYWEIVFSDMTDDRGGNDERIGYLYDSRMVKFTGLAAEADAPRVKKGAEYVTAFDWWRSPYMASFTAGNFDFVLLTAHMRWGKSLKERINALDELRKWVLKRRRKKNATDHDFIVMGDFNIPKLDDKAFNALTGNGRQLHIPEALRKVKGTNLSRRNNYDQILHSPTKLSRFSGEGGALDFYCDDWEALFPHRAHRPADKHDFTYWLSDHLPLWLQVRTDFMDRRLQVLAQT